jgi:hypothetical protein
MIQPSALNFLIVLAMMLIAGFFVRSIAARYSDGPLGKALGYIY